MVHNRRIINWPSLQFDIGNSKDSCEATTGNTLGDNICKHLPSTDPGSEYKPKENVSISPYKT